MNKTIKALREERDQLYAEIRRLQNAANAEPSAPGPDLSELREYHAKAARELKAYADDSGLRDSDVKHYLKRAAVHEEFVAVIDEVARLNPVQQ